MKGACDGVYSLSAVPAGRQQLALVRGDLAAMRRAVPRSQREGSGAFGKRDCGDAGIVGVEPGDQHPPVRSTVDSSTSGRCIHKLAPKTSVERNRDSSAFRGPVIRWREGSAPAQ